LIICHLIDDSFAIQNFTVNVLVFKSLLLLLGPAITSKSPGSRDVVEIVIIEFEHVGRDGEFHFAALTFGEMDATEPFQFFHGAADAAHHVADIELHHLVGIIIASVCHRDCRFDAVVPSHVVGTETQVAIFECGVAHAETERIERVVAHVKIGAGELGESLRALGYRSACGLVIIIERFLTCRLWQGRGELAARHLVAEEHVADGIGSLAAAKPHIHDGRQMARFPCEHGGPTRIVEQDDRFARLDQCLQQFVLHIEEFEIAAAGTFAAHLLLLAHGADDDVGLPRDVESLGFRLRVVHPRDDPIKGAVVLHHGITRDVAALRVEQLRLALERALHTLIERVVFICGSHAPRARHIEFAVGERSDERYLALLFQGQRAVVVFQQDDGFSSQVARRLAVFRRIDVGGAPACCRSICMGFGTVPVCISLRACGGRRCRCRPC
jgi:hypothetical protein